MLRVALSYLRLAFPFFGMEGSHNDINVLQPSPVFRRLADDNAPSVGFEVMGHAYTKELLLS
jgi:hypothetical protein